MISGLRATMVAAVITSVAAPLTFAGKAPLELFQSPSCIADALEDCAEKGGNVYPVRTPTECEIALLSTGTLSLQARLKTLEAAKKSIRIRALIFSADESGLHIARVLKQKVKEGVRVVVMVDAISNLNLPAQWMYYDLKMAGVEVEGFEIPWQIPLKKLTNLPEMNKRYHDKLWIIDGEDPSKAVAIAGGMNIANEYFQIGSERERLWRDQDLAVRGEIINDLIRSFDQDFAKFQADKNSNPDILNSNKTFPIWRRISSRILSFIEKLIGIKFGIPLLENKLNRTEVEDVHASAKKLELDFRPTTARFIQSRPRYSETHIQDAYLEMIRTAKKEILISNAYFLPREELRQALKDAVRRGVDVKIVTNSKETNDLAQLSYVARYLYADLLSVNHEPNLGLGRMHIYEFEGHRFLNTIHAKFAVFDSMQSIVGSFNLDPRSELLNSETVFAIQDAPLAGDLRKDFLEHDVRYSKKISWDQAVEFRSPSDPTDAVLLELSLPFKDQL